MHVRIAGCLLTLLLALTSFVSEKWTLTGSSVTFEIKNAGLVVKGTFKGLEAAIGFDPAKPAEGAITASIDAATIDTGIGLRDKHLKKEAYFYVEKYPRITMVSTKIEKTGDKTYLGYFDVTVKGITKTVNFPFTFVQNGNNGVFRGDLTLNRLNYQVGESSWIMADDVKISIQANVSQ